MLAADGFPWDVLITAIATLAAALGGAWFTVRRTHELETRRWQLDRQAEAVAALMAAGVPIYNGLRDRFESRHSDPKTGLAWTPTEWTDWNGALEFVGLMSVTAALPAAAREWDRQTWRLSRARRFVNRTDRVAWIEISRPYVEAQERFIDAARQAFGNRVRFTGVSGAPSRDTDFASEEYWRALEASLPADEGDSPGR